MKWNIDFSYLWYEGGQDVNYEDYENMFQVEDQFVCDFLDRRICSAVGQFNGILADDLGAYVWNIEVDGNEVTNYAPEDKWLEVKPGMAKKVADAIKQNPDEFEAAVKEYLEEMDLIED